MKTASGAFNILKQVATFMPALDLAKGLISPKKPQVNAAAVTSDLTAANTQSKAARTTLLATEGDINGQELSLGQVGKRDTLLGN